MRQPNPKGLRRLISRNTVPKQESLSTLKRDREITEDLLNKLISIEARIDTVEFRWLVDDYIPALSLQMAVGAFEDNDPADSDFTMKMAAEHAKISQNKSLTDRLYNVRREIEETKRSISETDKAIEQWHAKRKKADATRN